MLQIDFDPCEAIECGELAIGDDTLCNECSKILCRKHYDAEQHTCRYAPELDDFDDLGETITACLSDLDPEAVYRKARELRPNHSCTITFPKTFDDLVEGHSGGFNVLIDIKFEDGVEWLLRLRRYMKGEKSLEITKLVRQSEVLTHAALLQAGVPVPEVHHWGFGELSKTINPRCAYMILSRLPGTDVLECHAGLTIGQVDETTMTGLIESYAEISIKIAQLRFEAIGSLHTTENDSVEVGRDMSFAVPGPEGQPVFGGPYSTVKDRYLYAIDQMLASIRKGWTHRSHLVLAYLMYLEARRHVLDWAEIAKPASDHYLVHPDPHAGNVLIQDIQVTGYIDWEWAHTTTKSEAFAGPAWLYESWDFELGDNAFLKEEELLCAAYEKRGRTDLADCVRSGRKYHRLQQIIYDQRLFQFDDNERILGAFNGLTEAMTESREPVSSTLEEWQRSAMSRHRDDLHLAEVIELEAKLKEIKKAAESDHSLRVQDEVSAPNEGEVALPT